MDRRRGRASTLAAIGRHRRTDLGAALVRLVGAAAGWALIAVGMPTGLLWLHRRMPFRVDVQQFLDKSLTLPLLVNVALLTGWALWAWMLVTVGQAVADRLRRRPGRRWRLPTPWHALTASLAGGVAAAVPGAGYAAPPPPSTPPPPPTPAVSTSDTSPEVPTVVGDPVPDGPVKPASTQSTVDGQADPVGPVYEVDRGDWLWHISARFLGDPLRYVEIEQLNPQLELRDHRFPDHIEATWTLVLPADAHDRGVRPHATGHLANPAPTLETAGPDGTPPDATQTPSPTPPPSTAAPTPTPTVPSTTQSATATAPTSPPAAPPAAGQDPDGVIEPTPQPDLPAVTTTPTPDRSLTTTGMTEPAPTTSRPGRIPGVAASDEHGITLPDGAGWLPWTLAGALVAAGAMVWLQRRRHHVPQPIDSPTLERPEPPDLPPTIKAVQRAWRHRPDRPTPPPPDPPPTSNRARAVRPPSPTAPPPVAVPPVPPIAPVPPGGLGLTGPGAQAAARGALVAALAAGAPTDPDAQSTVVIPADDLTTLLGTDASTLSPWPRLHVTPDLDTALTILEARLLGTARLLDEHDTTEFADLRAADSTAPPLPPMLLVATAPPATQRERCRMVLGLGQRVDVTALLLGEWEHGSTVTVDLDGTCHRAGGDGTAPDRLPVLDPTATQDVLRTLREAHTGEPAQPPVPEPPRQNTGEPHDQRPSRADDQADVPPAASIDAGAIPLNDADSPQAKSTVDVAGGGHGVRARVQVLGRPQIANRPPELRQRVYSLELLTYLAVHADGATSDQIMEDLWPDTRRGPAAQRLHAATSNLRQLLTGSIPSPDGGGRPDTVVKVNGRWRLNPDTVDLDLWRLRAAHTAARTRTGAERLAALRQVCDLYTGPLAGDEDYEWISRHRQGVLTLAIDAHTALAATLADTDPAEARRLLHTATEHDPLNEDLARDLMRLCHRAGDLDAVRATLRRLRLALQDIGAEPAEATLDLADELRRDLNPSATLARPPVGDD